MNIVPGGYIEVKYSQIARLRGEEMMMPFVLLKDAKERTIALPLDCPQGKLVLDSLENNDCPSQPHQALLGCLEKLGAQLEAVRINYSEDFNLPTCLVIKRETGENTEVDVSCADAVVYSQIAGVPIYVAEELMQKISATPDVVERRVRTG